MEKAVTEEAAVVTAGKTEQISLRMIQAFAMEKNYQGLIKKAVNTAGSLLATAGGVAGTVAAIAIASGVAAGASLLVATPVGWALAGMAAVIGLGMAGYTAWRFFSKRWDRTATDATGNKVGTLERIGKTLAFWKSTGPSKRDIYATRLYDLAKDGSDAKRMEEARATIKALGLSWVGLNMDGNKAASVKLIAAKMAS
jgi:hypothetical protein